MRAARPGLGLALLLLAALPAAAEEASLAGSWPGAIELPGQQLRVVVELAQKEGAWTGTVDIPAQGAADLPLEGVVVEPPRVRFAIAGVPGAPTFDGTADAEGAVIAGTFTQGGQSFPFRLSRQGGSAADAARAALAEAPALVQAVLAKFLVPSAGVAVVAGGEVVLATGYGTRDLEAGLPASADTLYAIGSVTKSFTAAVLAAQADDGKLELDQPVVELLPEFRLADAERTSRVTVRDLLAHRTGLPRHDLGWYGDGRELSREQVVHRLRFLTANTGLREQWQYQNWMFTTAGYLAGRLDGTSWEEAVRARLLLPLGMRRAVFTTAEMAADGDRAVAYEERDGERVKVPYREFPAMAPAGAINASASDMGRWLLLHLGRGEVDGRRILASSVVDELHQPAMVMAGGSADPEVLAPRYALGWFTDVYRGHRRVHHGGNIDGFSALATFFPDAGVGIVVLANLGGTPAPNVITRTLSDRLLELEPIDWLARIGGRWDAARAAGEAAEGRAGELRRDGAPPPRPLAEYAGEYEHPGYGRIAVEVAAPPAPPGRRGGAGAGRLRARFHGLDMELEPWHFETFRATSQDPAISELKLFLQFVPDSGGEVVRLEAPFEALLPPIEFTKLPPARLSDPAFLARLAGVYVDPAQPEVRGRIEVAGDALRLLLPAQPPYTLEPLRGIEFRIRELPEFRVRFVLDAAGERAVELHYLQPDGVYVARRVD